MGKVKKPARKVYTPGSRSATLSKSHGPGRPKTKKKKAGSAGLATTGRSTDPMTC